MRMDWKSALWYFGWLAILLLSLDFWNWNETTPLIYGIPFWVISLLALTLALSAYYALFARHAWGDGSD